MAERKWMGHDWQPTVSEPDRKVYVNEAKEIYLQLLHQKLRERVVAGEMSQAEMDSRLIRLGLNLPTSHLFPSAELKKLGIDQVTVSRGNLEMCAKIMADSTENAEVEIAKREVHDVGNSDELN